MSSGSYKRCLAPLPDGKRCRLKATTEDTRCEKHKGIPRQGTTGLKRSQFKVDGFERERGEHRKEVELMIERLRTRKDPIAAYEIARFEYLGALDRWRELDQLADHDPRILADRSYQHATTERRLAGRHVIEAESSLGTNEETEESKQAIAVVYSAAAMPTA